MSSEISGIIARLHINLLSFAVPSATGYSVHVPMPKQPPHLIPVIVVVRIPTAESL